MIGRWGRVALVAGLVGAGVVLTPTAPAAMAAVDPLPNPPITKACGIDLTLVLDASGSVNSAHAVEDVRSAGQAFLDGLKGTSSSARVLQFATASEELASRQIIDDASLSQGGAFGKAIAAYYNPKPPVTGIGVHTFRGGNYDPRQANSWTSNSSDQYTNWQQSLKQTAEDTPKLVVYVTDGDPTAYDFDRPGDPFYHAAQPYDIGIKTDGNSDALAITMDRAVEAANAVKTNGSRMLAVGVGSALNNSASQQRLTQISGPDIASTVADFDIETTDVALVKNYSDLAQAIRTVVLDLCSPSLTIQKLAQTAGNADYRPAQGWSFTTTPTVTPPGFDWVLPDTAPATSKTVLTDSNGYAQFQWEPQAEAATSTALVSEILQAGYTAGRPGADNDFRCEAKNVNNVVRVITGDLDTAGPNPAFNLDPIGNEIVTCSVYNSFNYAPAIAITKTNDPTAVRGDLNPGQNVTSTYDVTNPGNTPLSPVTVNDDKCGPVTPILTDGHNTGDTNQDDHLDPVETWRYTCTDEVTGGGGTSVETITNTATARGVDPAGTVVTAVDTATVDVYTPEITLTKLVDGQPSVTVELTDPPTQVTYTYAAQNTGNTPLGSVTLADDTPPCTSPTRDADPNGNEILDVGETWTYSCQATPTASVTNTATVTGTPLNPAADNQPFPDPNPAVSATDTARVQVVEPGLVLTKTVDHDLVIPGTPVIYTYTAQNDGDVDLRNDTGDPAWIADNACSPVSGVPSNDDNQGDTNDDDLLNPGETWTFTCSRTINELTQNTATIVAQPVVDGNPVGGPLTRVDRALVRVLTPAIDVVKTNTTPVVLNPDATPVSGPDFDHVPPPRPATFVYEVTNPGDVPLAEVTLTDDTCASVGFVGGDENTNNLLDVDEVWNYTCTTVVPGAALGQPSAQVTNTATAAGTPTVPDEDLTGEPINATDTAETTVIHPDFEITKTASQPVVRAGRPVVYTIAVRNIGDVPLKFATLNDDKCAPLEYVDGDTNGNDLLDGVNDGDPETFTFTCTRTLDLPPAPATEDVNTVSGTLIDPLGNGYKHGATATVHVIDPEIALVKSVSSPLVPAGTGVTYGFDVTNAGGSPVPVDDVLAQVVLVDVSDPAVPSCARPTLIAKTGGNQDDLLDRDPAETWHFECQATIDEPTTDIAAVGAIGGTTAGLTLPVVDFDAAFVQPFTPAITVEKSAEPTELPDGGGPVTYTYTVRNTGDVPLADVTSRITDDTCSPVTYVSGDDDGDGLLDTPTSLFEDSADETWTFTCTTTVNATTTNTVVVTGTPTGPGGELLCGTDSINPQIVSCDTTGSDTAMVDLAGTPTAPPTTPVNPDQPDGSLPDTGTSGIGTMLAGGAIALMLGGLLVALARRRGLADRIEP
ncbi:MAG TPA: LPXTG cell wall anchor domain-containing protein [Nakamurella sp.]